MRALIASFHDTAARRPREAARSGLLRALRHLARPFRADWNRRAERAGEAEETIRPAYEVALRLTGEAGEAEALVERALDVRAAWQRTRGNVARAAFRLFDALYATHRAAHGFPVREEADAEEWTLASDEPPLPIARAALDDVDGLRPAVDALPDGLWHALWLRDHQGFGYEDIGLLLDVPSVQVARLVSEARRRVMMTSLHRPASGPPA